MTAGRFQPQQQQPPLPQDGEEDPESFFEELALSEIFTSFPAALS